MRACILGKCNSCEETAVVSVMPGHEKSTAGSNRFLSLSLLCSNNLLFFGGEVIKPRKAGLE